MENELIRKLTEKRAGYEDERRWHKFLLDAYAGVGGFQGKLRQPFASFWGWAADAYADASLSIFSKTDGEHAIDTYLDRFPREDLEKFQRRANSAHYVNLVEPVVDLRLSFLNRKPFVYDGVDALFSEDADDSGEAWAENAGDGRTWHEHMRSNRLVAALLGWRPVLIDVENADLLSTVEPMSRAQAEAAGVRAKLVPMFPAHVWDWQCDATGALVWAKLGRCYQERWEWDGPALDVERVQVWTRTHVLTYRIERPKGHEPRVLELPRREHGLGVVPLVSYRGRPIVDDDGIQGHSTASAVAGYARKLYNYLSELDEMLAGSTFPMLQAPIKSRLEGTGASSKKSTQQNELVIGASNLLPVAPDSSREWKWVVPEAAAAQVYEERIKATIAESKRVGRTEFMGAAHAQSGVSRAFEFEGQNRAIADLAQSYAQAEQAILRLVHRVQIGDDGADDVRVIAPDSYAVEEMEKELEKAILALDLGLGATAGAEIRKRIAGAMLPNLSAELAKKIDAEIEALAAEQEQAKAAEREMALAGAKALAESEGESDDDNETPPNQRASGNEPGQGSSAAQ